MKTVETIKAREIRFQVDDAAILAAAAKVASQRSDELSEDEEAALAAIRRAHPSAGSTDEELGQWLVAMDSEQLQGVISNTKGVLHEMRFVELENLDGDTVYAAQFAATNHQGFDVVFSDQSSGAQWAAQLKATESSGYVNEWLKAHPDGQLLVTSEIAERLGLESSGVSNAELTADTEDLVDRLIASHENDTLWDYVPALSALSIAMVIFELHKRLEQGEIPQEKFKWMVAKASGQRAGRVLAVSLLLSIPGLNMLTALVLIANALASSGILQKIQRKLATKIEAMDALSDFKHAVMLEKVWIELALEKAESQYELAEKCKDENFRRSFEEAKEKIEAVLAQGQRENPFKHHDDELKHYKNPDDVIPGICEDEGADQLVRAMVEKLQSDRQNRFEAARLMLRSERLNPHFRQIILRNAGVEGGQKLLSAIMSR